MPGPQFTEDELIDMDEAAREAAISAMMAEPGGEPGALDGDENVPVPAEAAPAAPVPAPAVAAGVPPADGVDAAVASAPDPAAVAADPASDEPRGTPVTLAPVFVAPAADDIQARLDKIAADKAALRKQYDAGDIDFDAFESRKDALSDQATDIKQEKFRADLAADMEQQRLANVWVATCDAFIADKPYKTNPRLYALLDMEVRTLGSTDTGKGMQAVDILSLAHKNLIDAGFIQGAAPAAAVKPGAKAAPNAALPPNLALVPAAETSATGGKWDSMIRMMNDNPEGYEDAVMKLSDADRDSLLRAQG